MGTRPSNVCLLHVVLSGVFCLSPETPLDCETWCRIDCPPGSYYEAGGCWECHAGFYCTGGSKAPRKCPPGTANPQPAKTDIQDCQACPEGSVSDSQSFCVPCPVGYSCDPLSGSRSRCKPGQYSLEGQLNCSDCPTGFVCPDGRDWQLCSPGREPAEDQTRCVSCPPGFFSSKDSPKCLPCLPGSYCPGDDDKSPPPAAPAVYLKGDPCSDCVRAQDSTQLQRSGTAAVPCGPGYYMRDRQPCQLCPPGHFCVDGVNPTPCPAGTYSDKEGSQHQNQCTLCPAGYYCLEGRSQVPGVESLCPEGFYCPLGTRSSHAYPCPAGTYNEKLGQGHRGSCKICSEGLFCPEGSSHSGSPCSRGKFCPAGTSREQDCPPGTYTLHIGTSRIEQCRLCPVGFYCLSNTSNPIPCQSGSFNPLEGQDEPGDCRPCPAGSACTRPGLSQPDTDCSPGYVCPAGSRSPTSSENACPAGTYSDGHDLSQKSQCDVCPARLFCVTGTGGRQRPPVPCPRGHYCPAGTKLGTQYKCPAGTWSDRTSLASDTECYPCPAGWFCLAGAETPTGKCNAGHFCPEGSQFGSQFPCPPGTFNLRLGTVRVGECSACPVGSYCPLGSSKPAMCPMGSYRAEQGARDVAECEPCPAGTFCSGIGMGSPAPCGAGNFSDMGSTACLPCPAGHYCNEDRTSRQRMLQLVCPSGWLCPRGMAVFPGDDDICPPGYYCPAGSADLKPCPNGTYGERPGLGRLEDCEVCPEGHYCYQEGQRTTGITSPTDVCPQGYHCPPGTGFPFSNPCQPGTYWNASAQTMGVSSCFQCPAGFFCDLQSLLAPKLCPTGFYCLPGSAHPKPCPEGTYSSHTGLSSEERCAPCDVGMFCAGEGLVRPTGNCRDGYYCPAGATISSPRGCLCPAGSYCPAGSGRPTLCPPGTYSNQSGLVTVDQCLTCPPGMFCDGHEGHTPSGRCRAGYYCPSGSTSPIQHEVREGFFSSEGAFRPEPCPPGTFQPDRGRSACRQCPPGTFCNQTTLSEHHPCLQGHFCPAGSIAPNPCPVGTYSNVTGNPGIESCELCPLGMFCSGLGLPQPEGHCQSGYFCMWGSNTSTPVEMPFGDICPAGYFCPKGIKKACLPGTWNKRIGAEDREWCLQCPPGSYCDGFALTAPSGVCLPGYFCLSGSASPTGDNGVTGDICPKRHFCPEGSPQPIRCPNGTYSNITGQATCYPCPTGHVCPDGDVVLCPAGYFCLERPFPCPPGTFNPTAGLTRPDGCWPCPPGMYCRDWGASAPSGPCQAGFFCSSGSLAENPSGIGNETFGGPCPVGHFCPAGSGVPFPCPAGTFSNRLSLSMDAQCTPCPPGFYCNSVGISAPGGLCLPGYYCVLGVSSSAPTGDNMTGDGGECPVGTYCPRGTSQPIACPAGTYNNLTRQELCLLCPAGFYCPENTSDYRVFSCPPGFYCPKGTTHASQFPCPRGYFNPDPNTQSLDSCLPCNPGHYCGREGLSKVSGKCDPGWFCVNAAWTPQPFDLDNYTSVNCLCPATATGGKCLPGFYCPEGSMEPIACTPGSYCGTAGLSVPTGDCSPGFFCTGASQTPNPTDGIHGDICPPGMYCEEGSRYPQPCPPGTFSPRTGLGSESECKPCLPGHYCQDSGLTEPSGLCAEGYFCPGRQTSAYSLPCPRGHSCPRGSVEPSPCEAGWYQNEERQTRCRLCQAGYYCDNREEPVGDFTEFMCPQGHFCPEGTQRSTQHSCPPGTYGARPGLTSIDGCIKCPPGKYCQGEGQGEPTGGCPPGYWCKEGAQDEHPKDDASGGICPPGQYCPAGTHLPFPCPVGTWSDSEGLSHVSECQPCPGGHFCNSSGQVSPSGLCAAGYYCAEGTERSTPSLGLCPPGHFCLSGSSSPTPCPPGTYMPHSGATECYTCPGGKYCESGSTPHLCPRGFYCPPGTGPDWKPCPPGTYSFDLGLENVTSCRICDGGKFCFFYNATDVAGACSEGYYCTKGSRLPKPELELPGIAGPCPAGHFCPSGTILPAPCPLGTYSWRIKLHSESECSPCPAGHYCQTPGLVNPSGRCMEGFYCRSRSISPHPSSTDVTGGPCPQGNFCPNASAVPQPCPPGTYNPIERQGSCRPCAEGFFCPGNSSSLVGQECPPGFYCPRETISSDQYPCPRGTYNPRKGRHLLEDCLPCDPGHYCDTPGQAEVTGRCSAGYYCTKSAISAAPKQGVLGDLCPRGHYCPEGSISPHSCPVGTYSNTTGNAGPEDCVLCDSGHFCDRSGLAFPSGMCDAGYFCQRGSISSRPSESTGSGGPCPPGHFCPKGTQNPKACPAGSFSDSEGLAQCSDCPEGFYCPTGASNKTTCPKGHYCPKRTEFAFRYPCPLGTFSDVEGAEDISTCQTCPPGMFCSKSGTERPGGFCAPGWFCPPGSIAEKPVFSTTDQEHAALTPLSAVTGMCPKGTFCPQGSSFPTPCTPGHYCSSPEAAAVSGLCDAGYYCSDASSAPNPLDGTTGNVCPPGHHCMRGSSLPDPCPPGTFSPHPGARSLEDCIPCTAGWFCAQWGTISPDTPCHEGWYCPAGTFYPQNPDHICPIGHYCPVGSSEPKACPAGQFQDMEGQSECRRCPAGSYCGPVSPAAATGEANPLDLMKPAECPAGYYCSPGTEYGHQHPCPRGTFSNKTGLASVEECSPCPGGRFCAAPGLSRPSGMCAAGYYCILKSQVPNPVDDQTGALCPPGYFCPAGSSSPVPCPRGTFQPYPGTTSNSSCLGCPGGKFCGAEGMAAISGNCSDGFYCIMNAVVESPVDGITGSSCPKGHFCPSGVASPVPCESGFFQDLERGSSCKICPAGFYCDTTESGGVFAPRECLAGHFCPEGSQSGFKHKCPPGTFGPRTQLRSEAECLLCPAGFYCASEGLAEPTGPCLPGYWCIGGAKLSNPADGVTGNVCPRGKYCESGDLTGDCWAGYFCDSLSSRPDPKLCPPGFYCPRGTESPRPCDSGSYAPFSGSKGPEDCQPCPAGYFCNGTGQPTWQGLCSPGFFCPPGQISPRPSAFRCPSGSFCPMGSTAPTPCESGMYQSQEGREMCIACPAGFYCSPSNASSGVMMPKICPAGHYCPPGASFITRYPCPPGTYGPKTGASSKSDCEPCPAGMFCSSEGLNKPTGYCHAGYYCSQGAINPTPINPRVPPSDHSLPHNDICPAGHYCPNGTQAPVPCPLGFYAMASGLSSHEECQPCPAGHYCAQAGLSDLSQASPCSAGYVCKEGSSVPCPSDGIHGYQCPVGFYCPRGSITELPCAPGTFSPMPGATTCLPCPAGSSCPRASMVEPASCPPGHYCPAMAAAPVPCPEGTFNPQPGALSSASCQECPAGRYCHGEANQEPDGPCTAGYYCEGEAADYIPQKTARFPLNGPCPPGHFCPEGTQSPKPCPLGTLKNNTGGDSVESCVPCYAGHFCAAVGLSSPTGECAAGFYCPADFNSISANAILCPKGHFCPAGASYPTPCPTGQFQPNSGSRSCVLCQPGFFCHEAVAGDPQKCPPHSYCPAGALVPSPCPNGTFTPADTNGLREKGDCLPCPPGKYCRGGKLQGSCAAGHFCLGGSSEYMPFGQNYSRSSLGNCNWGQMCAGICPPGFYCQEGTVLPNPCPANTLRTSPGARHRDDCLPCPLGHWCREGSPLPLPCPMGHFCSGINQTNPSQRAGPQKCPAQTYRSLPGAESPGDCHPCPPGYHCRMPGTVRYEDYPCPPGHWCSGLSHPVPCPAGTRRPSPGASSLQDCELCPEGYYCPDPTSAQQPNVMGIPCRAGYECPLGSITETLCRVGSYCAPRTGTPPICPGGYFCPEGSSTYNTSQQLCAFPYYCPPGSLRRLTCTGGSTAVPAAALRDSAETSCRSCEAGTHRASDTTEVLCLPCPAGYNCPHGVEDYKMHPCQAGYYCPARAESPVPCPPGTYGNGTHAQDPGDCHPCPPGTYNHLFGQVACFSCGSSSYSSSGARSCVCRGLNRAFQESDGSCVCQTGFVFYDDRELKPSHGNSDQDCQPRVEERCAAGEERLASTRKCVSPERYDCTPFCGLQGGELSPELGMCHCTQYVSAEEICDRSCLAKVPRISMSFGSNKQFLLQIEEPELRRSRKLEVLNVLGPDDHVWSSKRVHLVLFGSSGIFGAILSSTQDIEAFLSGRSWSFPTPRRSQEVSTDLRFPPRIPNPILCLKQGDIVLFQLSISPNDRASSHYPSYQKDHLYNTNPHWDFGPFRRLDHLIKETHVNISRFAHVFGDPGAYIFVDNGVKDRSLFVTVKAQNVECDPAASRVQPSSPYQLVKHGFVNHPKLNLAPNWWLIIGVLLLLFSLMILLLVLAVVFRQSRYSPNPMKAWKPRWRSLGEPYIPPEYVLTKDSLQFYENLGCCGSGEILDVGKKEMAYGTDRRATVRDLEDFNVRTLFDKLEDQNLHLTSQIGRHRNDTLTFYKAFIQRIQVLKDLLQGLDFSGCKDLEWRKIPLEGDLNSACTGAASQCSEESTPSPGGEFQAHGQGLFWQEAASLMKVLKVLMMKLCSEQKLRKSQGEPTQKHREGADSNKGTCQNKNLYFGHGNERCLERLHLQPLLFMPTLYREADLKRLLTASPLTRTLEEIKEALKVRADEGKNRKVVTTPVTSGALVPMDTSKLSARQLIVYRFGCAILHLLCQSCIKKPLQLLIAEAIPTTDIWDEREELWVGKSYYNRQNNVLFIPAVYLEHIGDLVVVIVHGVAQIKAELSQPFIQPEFLKCMNAAIGALAAAFFHHWDKKRMTSQTLESYTENGKSESELDLTAPSAFGDLLYIHRSPMDISKRLEFYKAFNLRNEVENILESNKTFSKRKQSDGGPDKYTLQEEELDLLNEEFLKLTMQALKNNTEAQELLLCEAIDWGEPPTVDKWSENRHFDSLLEIKRRCTAQRISSLESDLPYLDQLCTKDSPNPTPHDTANNNPLHV